MRSSPLGSWRNERNCEPLKAMAMFDAISLKVKSRRAAISRLITTTTSCWAPFTSERTSTKPSILSSNGITCSLMRINSVVERPVKVTRMPLFSLPQPNCGVAIENLGNPSRIIFFNSPMSIGMSFCNKMVDCASCGA